MALVQIALAKRGRTKSQETPEHERSATSKRMLVANLDTDDVHPYRDAFIKKMEDNVAEPTSRPAIEEYEFQAENEAEFLMWWQMLKKGFQVVRRRKCSYTVPQKLIPQYIAVDLLRRRWVDLYHPVKYYVFFRQDIDYVLGKLVHSQAPELALKTFARDESKIVRPPPEDSPEFAYFTLHGHRRSDHKASFKCEVCRAEIAETFRIRYGKGIDSQEGFVKD